MLDITRASDVGHRTDASPVTVALVREIQDDDLEMLKMSISPNGTVEDTGVLSIVSATAERERDVMVSRGAIAFFLV